MLQIACPHCGPRNESEFVCGGESHIVRPDLASDDQSWAAYLFFRTNPGGVSYERWCHRFGCEAWFNVARHTVSHAISRVYPMTEAKPRDGEAGA